jgi:hypothetical protein
MDRHELQILTNCIHSSDTRYVHVTYPFYELELFTLDIKKPELKGLVPFEGFDTARMQRKPVDRGVSADELPTYNDLKTCLLTSGFVRYRNHAEVARQLQELRDEAKDPNKRPRPVFVAVDTNVLYYRFLSRCMPMRDPGSGRSVEATDFRYVLSEIVQVEIDSRITHKYSRGEIDALGQLFAHKELLQEFRNASGRRERLAKLAFNEMNYLMAELRALRVKGTPVKGKERNDIEIAQSYGSWAKDMDYDVLLLTADEDMMNHARTNELMAIQLDYPHDVPQHGKIDPWAVSDLLYDLAVTFGAVSLENPGLTILGEWAGKNSLDYGRERVKVLFEDEREQAEVERQQGLCRGILS